MTGAWADDEFGPVLRVLLLTPRMRNPPGNREHRDRRNGRWLRRTQVMDVGCFIGRWEHGVVDEDTQ